MKKLLFIRYIYIFLLLPDMAFAANPIEGGICEMGKMLSDAAHAVSILLLISLGILAMFNKVTWGVALLHGVGAAVISGAGGIVDSLATSGTTCA